ncbi:MAG: prepilin-type N-terminal cleavage/methylation domain-containing protein [Candidatus Omnitrophica bacterium]|nr:prepilin-type N-terminal cleavage/methylation domain-containing protein [Candidatus Omnitrophota bacterium]
MARLTKVKSAIGNRENLRIHKQGFTFIEVMVALVVLASGIVLIYKSFLLCADYLNNLTCRLYASSLIDEKIGHITESFAQWPLKSLDLGLQSVTMDINHKPVTFNYDISLQPLTDVKSVWQLDVRILWKDGLRNMRAQRSAYMIR